MKGGARAGAGRPKLKDEEKIPRRPVHAFRLWDDELEQIRRVHRWIKTFGVDEVRKMLDSIDK